MDLHTGDPTVAATPAPPTAPIKPPRAPTAAPPPVHATTHTPLKTNR